MNRQDAAAQGLEATEFEKRLVRAQTIMHRYGFDALLCTAPALRQRSSRVKTEMHV
jgi:hypothetical protein